MIAHTRARVGVILAAIAMMTLAACTPAQVEAFKSLTPDQQSAVLAGLQAKPSGGDCISAMKRTWPASTHAWAEGVIRRESGNDPRAQNRSSSAAGCWQLLSLHAHRIPGGWANRYDADANCQAALSLYQDAGTSPWRA